MDEPEPLKSGDTCVCGEPCLHRDDARKRVRRMDPGPGGRYQALPCRRTSWWHIYFRAETPTRGVRKKTRRRDAELRRKIEGE